MENGKDFFNLLLFQLLVPNLLILFLQDIQPQQFEQHEQLILQFCVLLRLLLPSKSLDQVSEPNLKFSLS